MSSAAKKMGKDIAKAMEVQQETRTEQFRIDLVLDNTPYTTYMVVSGIPKDLPPEYDNTIVMAAERQFANAINEKSFLEFYERGKNAKDSQPDFINIKTAKTIRVEKIEKVTE